MKNRRFPYGYEMQNGEILINKAEAHIVKRIFSEYIGGSNLKELADDLTKRHTEYLPGEAVWNKCRVKRMLEDKRYLGDDTYPAIITEEDYNCANALKDSRSHIPDNRVTPQDKPLLRMAHCAVCGTLMSHRIDNTQKHYETWYCKTESCDSVKMSMGELQTEITAILNRLTKNPSLADIPHPAAAEPSAELRLMENEVERSLETLDFDKDAIQKQILMCAAKKYSESADTGYITERLKADFAKADPLSAFSMELTEKAVSAILLGKGGTVQLKLKNGKIIGKEMEKDAGTDNNSENGAGNPAEAGICG